MHYQSTQQEMVVWQRASLTTRTIAMFVIVTFLSLILSPTVHAVQNADFSSTTVEKSHQLQLSKAVRDSQKLLEKLSTRLADNSDIAADLATLESLQAQIETLKNQVTTEFEATGLTLQEKKLPQAILDRHAHAVNEVQSQLNTLQQNLVDIQNAATTEERKAKVDNAKAHLNSQKHKRAHQPINPADMGNKNLKAKPDNKPKQNPDEFARAGLFNTPYLQLAALGDFTYDKLPGASDPAFLTTTPEITLSQAIQDQAAWLGNPSEK